MPDPLTDSPPLDLDALRRLHARCPTGHVTIHRIRAAPGVAQWEILYAVSRGDDSDLADYYAAAANALPALIDALAARDAEIARLRADLAALIAPLVWRTGRGTWQRHGSLTHYATREEAAAALLAARGRPAGQAVPP